MPKINYINRDFNAKSRVIIDQANTIIAEYAGQGFDLTLRQLYYQFVSRAIIDNDDKEYKRLGSIINDARLAGLIDWDHITDRTRFIRSQSHWETPAQIMVSAASSFRIDKWADQPYRPEVWIEKDALVGVIEGECQRQDIPFFSCRGYTSQSEMWSASQRLQGWVDAGQIPVIFHLGDHDPSGVDMSRDINDRLEIFMGGLDLHRIALNMDQVERFRPPPNPAKISDARASGYIAKFGTQSWELDALDPTTIAGLIRGSIDSLKDQARWREAEQRESSLRGQLRTISDRFDDVVKMIGGKTQGD